MTKSFKNKIEESLDHDFLYLEDVRYDELEGTSSNYINIYKVSVGSEKASFCHISNAMPETRIWMTYPNLTPIKKDCDLHKRLEKLEGLAMEDFYKKRESIRKNSLSFILTD
ncbi:hypothetical protein N9948_00845 [bacterium]|nr:hypothetical protein [bacterium]